jgi:hypothetical protein
MPGHVSCCQRGPAAGLLTMLWPTPRLWARRASRTAALRCAILAVAPIQCVYCCSCKNAPTFLQGRDAQACAA